jgi:hypothetical protein
MRAEIESVLELQPSWVARGPSDEMQLRGLIVRNDIPEFLRERIEEIARRLLCEPQEVEVEGKDSTGYFSRVPWIRVANRTLSPDPRTGWYLVYLFAENGNEAALSLIQGTQVWDGASIRSQPKAVIDSRTAWARRVLREAIADRARLVETIQLGVGDKGPGL